ncbi:TPA: hypothetical protein ENG04_12095 [Candidatus Poribacteria bacterium]|nr:hypothetical protein [Candidatus Poribacteria bacterium]HEX30810.1 hypothetical protein [Candidatus Poribacteria bacterium]
MTQTEILEELRKFTISERLTIIETALRLIREDLQQVEQSLTRSEKRRLMATAAKALLQDYATDDELTIFTTLDGEDFYAEG